MDYPRDGGRRPRPAGLPFVADGAVAGGREAEGVEALGFALQGRALRDVAHDLRHHVGLCEVSILVHPVAVGDAPHVLAVSVRSVQNRLGTLPDALAVVLVEGGEHLEDEPSGRGKGVDGSVAEHKDTPARASLSWTSTMTRRERPNLSSFLTTTAEKAPSAASRKSLAPSDPS